MSKIYARIQSDTVAEIIDTPNDIDTLYTAEFVATLVDVTGNTPQPQTGWSAIEAVGVWTFAAPPAPPAPTAEQVLATKIAAGIAITSTATPALNATYALDAASTAQIFQLGLFASQFEVFPGGLNQPYPDATGVPHVFTVAQFVSFLRVVAPLVSALTTQAGVMAQGGTPTWPAQSAVIP